MRRLTMPVAIAGVLWGAAPAPLLAQDMMATCAAEIGQHCTTVSRGRGRILACLIGHDTKLSAACKSDVTATAQKGARNPLVPSGVRAMLGSGGSANVPSACSRDVSTFCPEVSPGSERTLACLYAHSSDVSRECTARVRAALD